jgi:hypothetical protein
MNTTTPTFKREILGQRRVQISALCSSSSKRHFFLFFSSNSTRSSSLSNDDDAGGCGASREQQSQPRPIPRLIARQHNTEHRHTEEEDEVFNRKRDSNKSAGSTREESKLPKQRFTLRHGLGSSSGTFRSPTAMCTVREKVETDTKRERERESGRSAGALQSQSWILVSTNFSKHHADAKHQILHTSHNNVQGVSFVD